MTTPPDTVFIRGLRVDTVIGDYDWERDIRQDVVLDIEIDTDIRPSAAGDALAKTVDYNAVATRVADVVRDSNFHLVEALAEYVAALILEEFNTPRVQLRVAKPGALSNARDVGVVIVRTAAERPARGPTSG